MKWALVDGQRSLATPGLTGACPGCGGEVVAKCGEVLQWHWAHRASECDPWSEPESEWHIGWKNRFPAEWQERVMGNHRADVLTPRGVIEFQKSSISTKEIREREQFYRRMIWVVDASEFNVYVSTSVYRKRYMKASPPPDLFSPERNAYQRKMSEYTRRMTEFETYLGWSWPRKSWLEARKAIFLDLGDDDIFQIKWIGRDAGMLRCKKISKVRFIELASRPESSAPPPLT